MLHLHLAVIAASSLSALLLYKLLLTPYFLSPLSKIPNAHFTAPLSSVWVDRIRRNGQEVLAIYELHRKHGSIVRLGPRELSVNSLAGLRTIYTGAFEKHSFYRDAFVNFFTENLVGMLANRPHARQKRMLSSVYSRSYLQESGDLRGVSAVVLGRLLPVLCGCAEVGEAVNVLPLFQAVGMDFTSAYLFGTRDGTAFVSDLEAWRKWLGEYERFKNASLRERSMGFIETWCLTMCRRMQGNARPNEVLVRTQGVVHDQLRSSLEKDRDARPLELSVASELLDHLVAGHETTGITFTYMMWELSQRPQLQAALRRELSTLAPSWKDLPVSISEGTVPALPSPAVINALPLLDAVVKETLRLHAPTPAPLPRVTPCRPEGTTIDGYPHIPGGVRVSSSAYSLHRISEVYPQPLEWLPERWLEPGSDKIHDMRRLFWPFGSGGRMCLGSNFALQEIKLVMAAVYANYSTSIVDDEGIEQDHAFISLPRGRKLMLKFTPVDV